MNQKDYDTLAKSLAGMSLELKDKYYSKVIKYLRKRIDRGLKCPTREEIEKK